MSATRFPAPREDAPLVVFDFDHTLYDGDSGSHLFKWLIERAWWRQLLALLAAPVAGPVMAWGLTGGVVAGLVPALAPVLHVPTAALLWWLAGVARVAAGLPLGALTAGHAVALVAAVVAAALALYATVDGGLPGFGGGDVDDRTGEVRLAPVATPAPERDRPEEGEDEQAPAEAPDPDRPDDETTPAD